MNDLALFAAGWSHLWHLLPLLIVVSLVYSATRHETTAPILEGAVRIAVWIGGFMFVFFLFLYFLTWFV